MEKILKESIDHSFFSDSMFKNLGNGNKKEKSQSEPAETAPRSERYLPEDEEIDKELLVTESMKKFMSKKLSDMVAKQICFVEQPLPEELHENETGIKLLNGFQEYLSLDNEQLQFEPVPRPRTNSPELKSIDLRECLFSLEDTIEELKHWANNPRGRTYIYREKNSILYHQEPENEFSSARKRNNWDERKIAKFKRIKLDEN
ncbi:hypothetical protein DMENIID0001_130240 [Sergentomyia squamirostris]